MKASDITRRLHHIVWAAGGIENSTATVADFDTCCGGRPAKQLKVLVQYKAEFVQRRKSMVLAAYALKVTSATNLLVATRASRSKEVRTQIRLLSQKRR